MTPQQRELIDELFRTFALAYLQRFGGMFRGSTDQETTAAIEEWKTLMADQLARAKLTQKAVKCGVDAVATRFPEYPPTMGEFVSLCRGFMDPVVALPSPRTHAGPASRSAMDRIGEMLGKRFSTDAAERGGGRA